MSSIMTNASAMTALKTLQATNKALETTQNRISTGYRVAEASDNAAYWSIATTMRSDSKALSSVQDALALGAGKVDAAYTGMKDALKSVDDIKQALINALGNGTEEGLATIQEQIVNLQNQLKSTAIGAGYAGTNLLATDSTDDLEIVASYNRASDGTTSVGKITVSIADITLMAADGTDGGLLDDVMAIDLDGADAAAIEGFLTDVETALSAMNTAASNLGSAKARIDLQSNFLSSLKDSIDVGVGKLVDADMSAESTRLQALQVQQQLGIQALSIANGNAQSILSLFR